MTKALSENALQCTLICFWTVISPHPLPLPDLWSLQSLPRQHQEENVNISLFVLQQTQAAGAELLRESLHPAAAPGTHLPHSMDLLQLSNSPRPTVPPEHCQGQLLPYSLPSMIPQTSCTSPVLVPVTHSPTSCSPSLGGLQPPW